MPNLSLLLHCTLCLQAPPTHKLYPHSQDTPSALPLGPWDSPTQKIPTDAPILTTPLLLQDSPSPDIPPHALIVTRLNASPTPEDLSLLMPSISPLVHGAGLTDRMRDLLKKLTQLAQQQAAAAAAAADESSSDSESETSSSSSDDSDTSSSSSGEFVWARLCVWACVPVLFLDLQCTRRAGRQCLKVLQP